MSRSTQEVYEYSSYSYFVQSYYAFKNGYAIVPLYPDPTDDDYLYHRKLTNILRTMSDEKTHWDYVVWMDADLIPLDMNLRIENVVASISPSAHIYLSKDVSSAVNTGCIVVRNTRWAKSFIRDWLTQKNLPGVINEQMGFEAIYMKRSKAERQSKISILDEHILNSIASPLGKQQPHHQILHLAAESNAMRSAVFHYAASQLCKFATYYTSGDDALPLQLGISREFLQMTAMRVYRETYKNLEAQIIDGMDEISIDTISAYRTSVSKYCYVHSLNTTSSSTSSTSSTTRSCCNGGESLPVLFPHTAGTLSIRYNAAMTLLQLLHYRLHKLLRFTQQSIGVRRPQGNAHSADAALDELLRMVIIVDNSKDDVWKMHKLLVQWKSVIIEALSAVSESTLVGPHKEYWQGLPELLKLCSELAFDLFVRISEHGDAHKIVSQNGQEYILMEGEQITLAETLSLVFHARSVVSFSIELLMAVVSKEQLLLVLAMKVDFYVHCGRIALKERRFSDARGDLLEALQPPTLYTSSYDELHIPGSMDWHSIMGSEGFLTLQRILHIDSLESKISLAAADNSTAIFLAHWRYLQHFLLHYRNAGPLYSLFQTTYMEAWSLYGWSVCNIGTSLQRSDGAIAHPSTSRALLFAESVEAFQIGTILMFCSVHLVPDIQTTLLLTSTLLQMAQCLVWDDSENKQEIARSIYLYTETLLLSASTAISTAVDADAMSVASKNVIELDALRSKIFQAT
eukprot:CAMPEP_0174982932 /NCGR_PEP_ID=MMETSP0004_2-20121128/16820_1 /TAXON_ID=420556 /ORGANISM="Ochromonas sp., Strain CCMP1393" /LENGTH=741 /DNA_ID=CAMNT_0016235043 /DNA_START=197 /DNA_END=2422 /DNA_ORIENTATION=-